MFDRDHPPLSLHMLAQPLVDDLWQRGKGLYNAANVLVKDDKIMAWLKANDPKAFDQLCSAIAAANN